jgi:hypothetical protein
MPGRTRAPALLLSLLLAVPSLARAGDPPAAEALFRQGIEAMGRADHASACPKFA